MSNSDLEIIEKWQSDPSFIAWATGANDQDADKWDTYFEANPEKLEMAELAKFSVQQLRPSVNSIDEAQSQAALSALQARIKASKKENTTGRIIQLSPLWRVAATLLILLTAGIWGYTFINGNGDQIVLTAVEEQMEVQLADGTQVTLNRDAVLTYSEDNVRSVQLEGEAYFEVAKQAETKANFTVKTNELLVTVLGTEFNVNSNDGQTSVYLDEGKVVLNIGNQSADKIEMSPGELVSYSKAQDKILENRKAKSLGHTAWKEKVILFEEAPLTEVFESVSLIYGVNCDFRQSSKKDALFTGGIPVNSLEISLQTLQDIYQLEIKKTGDTYLIQ